MSKRRKFKKKPIIVIIIIILMLFISNYFVKYTFSRREFKGALEQQKTQIYGKTTKTTTYNNEEVLLNPGKGFVIRDTLNRNYDDIVSVGYYRTNWDNIEPEEGKYNWEFLDSKIEDFRKRGKKFAFRIACASSTSTKKYVTPKWVFDAGAQYYTVKISDELTQIVPVWTDKIFLEKLNNFIKALAERYDGNENIAYIDIGGYGNWGEQHVGVIGGTALTNKQLQELYITPYKEAFKNTLLVNPWGHDDYKPTYQWGIEQGITIRRDGIFGYSDGTECALAYGKLPTIFEYANNYQWMLDNNLWSQEKLLQYIKNGKPSYVEFDINMYKANEEFCKMIANKIGYYFKFKSAEYTNSITTKEQNQIKLNFINEGVAPLYEPCTVYIGLLDNNYELVKKYKTDIDPHSWMPEEQVEEIINLQLDGVKDEKYIIALGLFLNENDEKPTYLLGNTGKTDDNWYAFGEIQITNPQEEYNINVENEDILINSYNNYNINIKANNLRKTSNYKLNIYINDNLSKTLDIDSSIEVYDKNIELRFNDGKNTYSIQIEKDDEIVFQFNKEIYVSNFIDNYQEISKTVTQKYTDFESNFADEICKVLNLSDSIENLKQNMINIENVTTLDENMAIKLMKEHYNLGNIILQEYKDKNLNIEYVKLSSMLDMLNDIGNSYEDLVTVSAKTRNPNLSETKTIINDAEKNINNNADLEIIYPQKILEFSKDLYEKAEYINNLEEENDIKTGLIVSNDLHAKYLAQWSKEFTDIYIEDYIKNNPITETYSTKKFTNQDVTVTLHTLPDTKITNNKNSNTYTFTQNGEFIFEYQRRGRNFTKTVKVENIDKIAPQIINIKNEAKYTESIIPKIEEENLEKVTLTKNEEEIEYILGKEIEEEGKYKLTVTDKAGNISEVNFEILKYQEDSYIIDKDKIRNIKNNTTKEYFTEKLNMPGKYKILHNKEELETEDIVSSGDILQLEDGKTYTLIVAGDINQDGKVTAYDLSMLRKTILNVKELNEVEKLAADVNCDNNKIGAKDYSSMKLIILGK